MTTCSRGCINWRRHIDDCEDETCRGCEPREAEHGTLCETCHVDLVGILLDAPRQVRELRDAIAPSSQWALTVPTTYRPPGPRIDSSAPDYIAAARANMGADQVEAIRLVCVDMERKIEDALSCVVDDLCRQYDTDGPPQRASQGGDDRRKVWLPAMGDGQPRAQWERVVTYSAKGMPDIRGQYVWVDPPPTFEVATACRWLREQLARLEVMEGIGDTLTELRDLMSQAHAVAPWREKSSPLPGVPCPKCHRMGLKFYNSPPHAQGSAQARCASCASAFPWARIAVWTRMYEQGELPRRGA